MLSVTGRFVLETSCSEGALSEDRTAVTSVVPGADWVEETLLSGRSDDVCLRLPEPVDRATLRRLVAERQEALVAAGLRPGGAAALRLPPSLAYVANLLAVWRVGAQAVLLDHRLTDFE